MTNDAQQLKVKKNREGNKKERKEEKAKKKHVEMIGSFNTETKN